MRKILKQRKKITGLDQICSNIKILAFSRGKPHHAYSKLQIKSSLFFSPFFPLKQMKYYVCDRASNSEWKSEKWRFLDTYDFANKVVNKALIPLLVVF